MTLVVAHRGASAAHPPGNTPSALSAAGPLGADWVELDVHATADGGLAVHHDLHLPDGRDLSEVRTSELPSFVPTLDAALQACAPLGINVEIKADGPTHLRDALLEGVIELLRAEHEPDRFLVTSFDHSICDRVRTSASEIPTGLLNMDGATLASDIARAARDGHVAVNPWHGLVDAAVLERARSHGVAINVWTVDEPERMRELLELGVDAIITNVPDVCRSLVDSSASNR